MKKLYRILLVIFAGIVFIPELYGQLSFKSTPGDTVAVVGEQYTFDANVYASPADTSFSLLESRPGMSINPATGLISWTPLKNTDGGKVVVLVTNTGYSETLAFYLYVEDLPDCDADFDNTVAYWKLDESDGPDYIDSYGSHDASVSGNSPYDSAGIVGRCQKFLPASNIELTAPDHSDFDWGSEQGFSISFWLMTAEADYSNTSVLIGRNESSTGPHWWVGITDNNELTFLVRNDSVPEGWSAAQLPGDKLHNDQFIWHHAVAVHDNINNAIRIYIDGTSEHNSQHFEADKGPGFICSAPLSIGFLKKSSPSEEQYPFHGYIDEVLIFKSILTTDQIDSLYNRGITGRTACLPGNAAPVFRIDAVTEAYEDNAYSYQFFADDVDGDVLTYSVDKQPSWATVDLPGRTISGTPDNSNVGSDSVVIKVNDGESAVYQRFLLTVVNTNDPPVITSSEITTVNEDEPYSYDVEASDVDAGDNLTFSLQPPTPVWLMVNPSSGLITGTPPANDDSEYDVTVRVTDDSSAYDEQSYTLDILPINDAPVITGQLPLDVDEDNSLLIQLSDVTYTDVDNSPGDMILAVVDGINYTHIGNTITPGADFSGALAVNIELSDLDSITSGQLDVTVNPVNDPPVIITFPDIEAWADQLYTYVFNANDIDNLPGELTYSITDKPYWLTWAEAFRTLSGTPGYIDIGIDTLAIRVSDGTNNVDSTFYITINTENNIPVITSTPVTAVNEDELYEYNITFEDADPGDIVTLSYVIKPDWLTLNVPEQILSGTPTNDQVGTESSADYQVQLRVYDTKQDSTQTFNITVFNVNDPPEIMEQIDTIGEFIGNPLLIQLSDLNVEDVDNVPGDLTLTVLPGTDYSLPDGDSIIISGGVTARLIEVNVRVEDLEPLQDEGILYVKVLNFVGIRDRSESNNLVEKVYPVPASEYIRFVINTLNDYKIEIIDITGKTVFEEHYTKDDRLVEVNTGNLPSGLYIYEVKSKLIYQVGRISVSENK